MTDTAVPHVRITGPSDLVASVPALLGFHPANSLVVVLLEDRMVRCTMRIDLAESVCFQADRIASVAQRAGATSVLLVIYAPGEDGALPWADAVDDTVSGLTELGVSVADALHVDDGRFRSYLCTDPLCCPSEGREVPKAVSELEMHRVVQGCPAVAGSREDVADRYRPRPDLAPSEAAYATQMSVSARPMAERCARAVNDTHDLVRACQDGVPVARDLYDARTRLAMALGDYTVRDHLLATLAQDPDLRPAADAVTWLALTTAEAYRAPVAATAACLQLAVGDNPVATWALLDLADGESLAGLMRAGIEAGLPPESVRSVLTAAAPAIQAQISPS